MGKFFDSHPKLKKREKLIYEILRFLLVGGLATVVDFGVYELCRYLIFASLNDFWGTCLSTACGFICGNIVNYILSIVFVFKGAKEDKKTQTFGAFMIFTLIGVIGLFIKMGCQSGGNYLFLEVIFKLEEGTFWYWFIDTAVYCIATLIVLVWNYVGRKLLIFKHSEVKEEVIDVKEEN